MSEAYQTAEVATSNQSPLHSTDQSWLLPNLVDVEDKMKKLLMSSISEEDNAGDTFAERAEWYYQRRPQLLTLLKDLYNGYITLLDRCQQSKRKHKRHFRRSSSEITAASVLDYQNEEDQESGEIDTSQIESDVESTISYQQQTTMIAASDAQSYTNIDNIVTELVTKNVENDVLLNQVNEMDQHCNESSRKIELLKNLLDLLESERMILMNENVKLGYKVSSLMEENKGLASDAMFMKRKAAELARCVLRMREDHRVCILSQKIEDLQEQIYGLEKRNMEYYQMMVKREQEVKEHQKSCSSRMEKEKVKGMDLESCLELEKIELRKKMKGGSKWWERVKKAELFNCGLNPTCA